MYKDLFLTWADVQREYDTQEPEPEEILFAYYGYESYDGNSMVAYRNANKYYLVCGGHCSCYGLEGQWNPEEYPSKEIFAKVLDKMNFDDSEIGNFVNKFIDEVSSV